MKICDDKNACTIDHLVYTAQGRKCLHLPVTCVDQDKCTKDTCDPTQGCSYQFVECKDNKPCTVEKCTPAHGCQRIWKSCADGDRCTVDQCVPATGDCVHTPLTCDDDDPCTLDSCQPSKGCVHEPGGCESPHFENLAASVLVLLAHDPAAPEKVLAPCAQKEAFLSGAFTEVTGGFVQQLDIVPPVAGVALCLDPFITTCVNEPAPLKQTTRFLFEGQPVDWFAIWHPLDVFGTPLGDLYAKTDANPEVTPPEATSYYPGVQFAGIDIDGAPVCTYSFAAYICTEELKNYDCAD